MPTPFCYIKPRNAPGANQWSKNNTPVISAKNLCD